MRTECCVSAFVIHSLCVVTTAHATAPDEATQNLELAAIRSLTELIGGAEFKLIVAYEDESMTADAKIETVFDRARVWIKCEYLTQLRGASHVADDLPQRGWQGPEYVAIEGDRVSSRNGAAENSTFRELQSDYPELYASKRVFWPQFIGTSPEGVWRMPETNPRGILERGDREVVAVAEENLNGLETVRVTYRTRLLGDLNLWFCPERNHLITRMRSKATTSTSTYETAVDTDLKEWAPNVWFPERITTVISRAGKELSREVAVVSDFQQVETRDEQFDVMAFELPEDEVVADSTSGALVYKAVTNEGLKPMSDEQLLIAFPQTMAVMSEGVPETPLAVKRSSTAKWILIGNAVVVVAIVAFVLSRTWSK